jgi:hypothetical protein
MLRPDPGNTPAAANLEGKMDLARPLKVFAGVFKLHCTLNNPSLKHQIECDWLDDVFKKTESSVRMTR